MLIPEFPILREAFEDDAFQLHRYAGAHGRKRLGILIQDLVEDRQLVVAGKRVPARYHLVEDHAQ